MPQLWAIPRCMFAGPNGPRRSESLLCGASICREGCQENDGDCQAWNWAAPLMQNRQQCDPRSWDKGFDLEWNLWTWILWLIQSQISRAVPKSRSVVYLWAQPTRRAIYITPTSYLELISSFKKAGGFQIHQSSFQLGLPSQTGKLGLVGRFWLWDEPGAQVRRRPPPEVSHRCDVWESESQSKSWEPILTLEKHVTLQAA